MWCGFYNQLILGNFLITNGDIARCGIYWVIAAELI